jgi:hypothetical protein
MSENDLLEEEKGQSKQPTCISGIYPTKVRVDAVVVPKWARNAHHFIQIQNQVKFAFFIL